MAKERKQKERKLLEKVKDSPSDGGFARALGSTDFHTRERGLQALTLWLSGHKEVTEKDLLRLWKALFYCFWHSDRVPTALAERLSEIMNSVPPAVGRLYFKVFVQTMRREWFGIDRHRMDKFMMLVRKFYAEHLRYLQSTSWDKELVEEFSDFWREQVLLPNDTLAAAGVAYHFTDLFLPELTRVVGEGGKGAAPSKKTLTLLLDPFCAAAATTKDAVLIRRLYQGVWEALAEEVCEPQPANPLKNLDVQSLADKLFELGAMETTRALNRETLYAASKELEHAAKNPGKPAKKAKKAAAAMATEEAADDKEKEEAAATKPKADKKRKSSSSPSEAGPSSNGKTATTAPQPASTEKQEPSKKSKKTAKAATTAAAPESAPSPSEQPPSTSSDRKNKKKDKKIEAAEPGGGDITPVVSPNGAGALDAAETRRRKSVRFSLKRNLVMTIGQPPLPEDIRTPPTSKPKGSALKVKVNMHRHASTLGKPSAVKRLLTEAPSSAPPKYNANANGSYTGQGKGKRSPVGTRSVAKVKGNGNGRQSFGGGNGGKRPRASDFF